MSSDRGRRGIDMIAYGHSTSVRASAFISSSSTRRSAAVRRIAEACNAHGKLA
jgi:hypothetical protein